VIIGGVRGRLAALLLSVATTSALGAALAGCGAGRSSGRVDATAGFASVSVRVPTANADGLLSAPRALRLPAGWSAEAWARVRGARFEAWTPERDLLVSVPSLGTVVELIPGPTPATPPRQKLLVSGLTMPQGLAFDTFDGARVLYIAESDRVDRYVWNRDGTLGPRTVVAAGLPDTDPSGDDVHRAKSIVVGRDHTLYVTGASASNASPEDRRMRPERGVIFAINPTSGKVRVFATGVRNGEGLSFAPDGSLWTAVNERDRIRYPFHRAYAGYADAFGKQIQAYVNDHPPDELARLTPGRDLGWPYCNPDPDADPGSESSPLHYGALGFDNDAQTNPGGRAFDCAKLTPLDRGVPAHSAPLGLHFLQGSTIAMPWRDGAVLATHGSWDRKPELGPAVLWFPWEARTRTLGPQVTLINGFQPSSASARWGRTVDAVPGPDGDLYVTDDLSGTVYRVGPAPA
jgi:glucose/arabinose dehydrogenase